MRRQPERPSPPFYFDGFNELVVCREHLNGPYPIIEACDDVSVVVTIESKGGVMRSVDDHFNSRTTLLPGERIKNISTGSDTPQITRGLNHYPIYQPGGKITGSYTVQTGDQLIVFRAQDKKQSGAIEERTGLIVPANEFLPDDEGFSYQAGGVIDADGKLIVWGRRAEHDRWFVDMAIALKLLDDSQGLYEINKQLNPTEREPYMSTYCSDTVRIYLEYFARRFGVDFIPTEGAFQSEWEIPRGMNRKQFALCLSAIVPDLFTALPTKTN